MVLCRSRNSNGLGRVAGLTNPGKFIAAPTAGLFPERLHGQKPVNVIEHQPRRPAKKPHLERAEQWASRQSSVVARPVGSPPERSTTALRRSMQQFDGIGHFINPPPRHIHTPIADTQQRVDRRRWRNIG